MQPARILILDDDPAIGEMLEEMLNLLGHVATSCQDPADALGRVQQESFDLIFSDFRMPGMEGSEFYRRVQTLKPELAPRIVFLTGDILSEDTHFFVKATGNPKLLKPFRLSHVKDLLVRLLGETSPGPALQLGTA